MAPNTLAIISDDHLQNVLNKLNIIIISDAGELRSLHPRKPTVKKCDRPWVFDDAFMDTPF